VVIPVLPAPLRWENRPAAWRLTADDGLEIGAGPRTDWFADPGSEALTGDAPALLMPAAEPWLLGALASVEHRATFDAAVLAVFHAKRTWAKLCLERSPDGRLMVVSVVTRGTSDDCNSVPVPDGPAHLRVARMGRAYAFHHSADGRRWDLVRYFSLADEDGEVGFLAQSPTGEGCLARFEDIVFEPRMLTDLRSGE
jgi:hypothetical protein